MDNETTRIMQSDETTQVAPQEQKTVENNTAVAPKTGKKKGGLAAAAVAAGVAGAAGAGAGAAAMHFAAPSEEDQEDAQAETQAAEVHTTEEAIHHEPQAVYHHEPAPAAPRDYTGHHDDEPVLGSDAPEEPDDDDVIEVLGVYNNENGDEVAVITDGEEVGVVVDVDDDGEANFIGVDENHNQHIEENEVYDISDQHVDMAQFGEPTNSGQEYVSEHATADVDDSYHPEYVEHEYHSDPPEYEPEHDHHHDEYESQHEEFEPADDYNDYQDVSGDEYQDDTCDTYEC